MQGNVGLWIDHEKAFLIHIDDQGQALRRLTSEVERQTRLHGGSRSANPCGGFDVSSEKKAKRRRENQLKAWYRQVLSEVSKAENLFVFGPGEAKRELLSAIQKAHGFGCTVVGVEPADNMSENQMAARVRSFFGEEAVDSVPSYRRPPGS
jgi:hypothetical protein